MKLQQDPIFSNANRLLFLFFFLLLSSTGYNVSAQLRKSTLFLGNSYTSVNNLPQVIYDVALSAGDTLIFDSYAPGGYQLSDHFLDLASQNKIMAGGWDYVVIQGQSQEPITLSSQFSNAGLNLHNLIKQYNPCAVTMPYMTWGRKNGDLSNCAAFPVMCTYQGMDTTLRKSYVNLTTSINGELSPVSVVWSYLRKNHPGLELYQPDESHPSTAGSYAAACCFYTAIFKKDPTLITFNFGLSPADASIIRNAVKTTVFDSLHLWDFKKLPISAFGYQIGAGLNEVLFTPLNQNVRQTYFWDFGDGNTSTSSNPVHSYLINGTYTVSLTTTTCDVQGQHTSFTDTTIQFCNHTPTIYTSNPWLCNLDTLWTQPADAYQWYANGTLLPETNQILPNYSKYNPSNFSVMVRLNGCSELSIPYTKTAHFSGYYFDAMGDPCLGDTVAFAVLHTDGFLSGNEDIFWYKNGSLLPLMTNEDTLLISSSGIYECKVINPNSICPLDTTSYKLEYDCGTLGVEEERPNMLRTIFPNPASSTITLKFSQHLRKETLEIYNVNGYLVRSIITTGTNMIVDIADLPEGLYYAILKNQAMSAVKFIKM